MRMLILKNMITASIVSFIIAEGALGKPVKRIADAQIALTKDTTTNVERRLMQLIEAPEEVNPPDGNSNYPQMVPESDILDEPTFSDLDNESTPLSEMPEFALNNHLNEGTYLTATPVNFTNSISAEDEEEEEEEPEDPKPVSKRPKPQPVPNPYDPTNRGTSKGGGHKGNSMHYKTVGIHNIPIIRMGEEHQPNGAFTIVKPWVR